jgi:hypothetical protein
MRPRSRHVPLIGSHRKAEDGHLPVASHTFAELLIDCEEDRVLRAVLVGMLRDADR